RPGGCPVRLRPRGPRRRDCYCLTYGRPDAAGGIERPITPATAISVTTYGRANKSSNAAEPLVGSATLEGYVPCRRETSALEKPNSIVAPKAPNGRQFPKIRAASATKPRPSVICSWKPPANETRYAPPAAARTPDTTTQTYLVA